MTRGKPFEHGNTAGRGRPKGSRNQATLARQAMLDEFGSAIIKKCMTEALKGDRVALRLCMERLVPPARHQAAAFKLPPIRSASDLPRASAAILKAAAEAAIPIADGQSFMQMLDGHRQILESHQLAPRIEALEQSGASRTGLELIREPESSAQQTLASTTVEEAIGEE